MTEVEELARWRAPHWIARDVIAHIREDQDIVDIDIVDDLIMIKMLALDLAMHSWVLQRSPGRDVELDVALHDAFGPCPGPCRCVLAPRIRFRPDPL